MNYTILEQLDNIIFQLNEDNNDSLLNDKKSKDRLKLILDLFYSLKTKFDNQYKKDNKEEKINDFISNLISPHKSAKGGSISLSDDIKANFENLFKKYLEKFYTSQSSQSNNSPTGNKNDLDKKKEQSTRPNNNAASNSLGLRITLSTKYSNNNPSNILSEENNVLTDDIINNKLKNINWKEINDDIESIKTEIDKL